jgi:hypothetical protein
VSVSPRSPLWRGRRCSPRCENASLRPLDLDVDEARILDAEGNELEGTVSFLEAFAHGLWAWSQAPAKLTDFERRRLGQIVTIKPGDTAPLALSWRVPEGKDQPVRVDFGDGATLPLPDAP